MTVVSCVRPGMIRAWKPNVCGVQSAMGVMNVTTAGLGISKVLTDTEV